MRTFFRRAFWVVFVVTLVVPGAVLAPMTEGSWLIRLSVVPMMAASALAVWGQLWVLWRVGVWLAGTGRRPEAQ